MGLFSFLFGGKKFKEAAPKAAAVKDAATKDKAAVKPAPAAVAPIEAAPVIVGQGVTQARLRLKLAASLRTGQTAAAYEAAKALADIQVRAGRKTVARVWQQQADEIKAGLGA